VQRSVDGGEADNLDRLGLDIESAFEPCANLLAMQTVLAECFDRASPTAGPGQRALRQALSCYYSGNFVTGFAHGYVRRVAAAAARLPAAFPGPATSPASFTSPLPKETS
jgi:type IV secretion system protein VirB1